MSVTASEVFDFIEQHPVIAIERNEINSAAFAQLRRNLRAILIHLADSEDAQAREICGLIRGALSEWLTVPVPFGKAITEILETLGTPITMARWGGDVRNAYEAAVRAVSQLPKTSPLRDKLFSKIAELLREKCAFKIYCHRRARPHFDSLFDHTDTALTDDLFLHSVTDYRETETFEVLVKVGPLRSRGWGAAPDALFTAPKFTTLAQFVWAGCSDEPGFGYDPIAPPPEPFSNNNNISISNLAVLGNRISRRVNISRSGDPVAPASGESEIEEFQIFSKLVRPGEKQKVLLVQIDDEHGMLYTRYSQVLSYDPNDVNEPIATRYAGETLTDGMFLIRPLLGEIDLGGFHASEGHYSRVWKKALREELESNAEGLCRVLRNKGVSLRHLRFALENWARPATGVIHAPQHPEHFEILIDVLPVEAPTRNGVAWWKHAWNEIRASRGDAIQAGFQEHELVQEQSLRLLRGFLPQIRSKAGTSIGFSLSIPAGNDLRGAFLFSKVLAIEEGFLAPDSEIKVVQDLNNLEQWRAD